MRRPEIVQALKLILQRVAPNATAILYGSEARGDARP
ncbi:MAG: nucleotidyltransferase domain-containing protein, partial [Candidatus Symbiothrix sp.]|nr:nucleotidyltransferase domain-containing protein [Candidatus Symbiothrix sp.]